jgi:hypothetical protein
VFSCFAKGSAKIYYLARAAFIWHHLNYSKENETSSFLKNWRIYNDLVFQHSLFRREQLTQKIID